MIFSHLTKSVLISASLIMAVPVVQATDGQTPTRGVPDGFSELAARLSPAVVNISTSQTVEFKDEIQKFPKGSPLERFNGHDFFGWRRSEGERIAKSLGSGFVIDAQGHVVTNDHVIKDSDYIEIAFPGGEVFEAKLIGTDPSTDIAVLKFDAPEDWPYVSFGESDQADVGDWVMAIGNPFGYGGSVAAGIISARNRDISQGPYDDFIQTDVAINKGNSGGPLFNMAGEVIGVNTAIFSPTGGSVGISFSVSADLAQSVVEQLIEYGETRRSRLGLRIRPQKLTSDLAQSYGLKTPKGAIISRIGEETPAQEAGLKRGDLIIALDGEVIIEPKSIYRKIAEKEIGQKIVIEIIRRRRKKTLTATLDRLIEPHNIAKQEAAEQAEANVDLTVKGVSVEALSEGVRAEYRIKDEVIGVRVVKVKKSSPAYGKLQPGDIIQQIEFEEVDSPKAFKDLIEEAPDQTGALNVQIYRHGNYLFYGIAF